MSDTPSSNNRPLATPSSNNRPLATPSSNNRPLATLEWIDDDNILAETEDATIYAVNDRVIKCFASHASTFDISHEYEMLKYLNNNPHTINVYANRVLSKHRFIEMERGWLNAFFFFEEMVENEKEMTSIQEKTFAFIVIYTLHTMWETQRIVHNDLHLENIFLMKTKSEYAEYEVDGVSFDVSNFDYGIKIADFGFGVKWSEPKSLIKFNDYDMAIPTEPNELYDVAKFCRCMSEFEHQGVLNEGVASKILKMLKFNVQKDFGSRLEPKIKSLRNKKKTLKDILLSDIFEELRII